MPVGLGALADGKAAVECGGGLGRTEAARGPTRTTQRRAVPGRKEPPGPGTASLSGQRVTVVPHWNRSRPRAEHAGPESRARLLKAPRQNAEGGQADT